MRIASTSGNHPIQRDSTDAPGEPDLDMPTGARLGGALLLYMLGVTLIITLLPFQFGWPSRWRIMYTGGVVDVVANVLLFVPLGFLFRLARANASRHSALTVLWVGALMSMAIESAQLFESERYTSVLDVVTNALGAWTGALLADRLGGRVRVDGALIGRLSLELPLMGLIYLLVPLLWLNALAAGSDGHRAVLSFLLGIFGAIILGGLQRHHFSPMGALTPRIMGAAAAAWFLAGGFPAIPTRPIEFTCVTLLVGALAHWCGGRPAFEQPENRRYEVPVLRGAAPAYAAYVVLLTVAPLRDGIGAWGVGVGFPGVATEWTKIEILRFLELVAACTLLGYMVAEFGGRVIASFRGALPRLCAWGLALSLGGELVRGWHLGHGASVARAAVLAGAALYGGWLYYLQRAHVVRLVGARRD